MEQTQQPADGETSALGDRGADLTSHFVHQDTGPALREQLASSLSGFVVQGQPSLDRPRAAVALAVIEEGLGAQVEGLANPSDWSRRPALLLTRRALTLRKHAGQWALPGGRIDGSESPESAALRELHEEVGIELDHHAVLGRLDDYATRSGFVITPVVVWAGAAHHTVANEAEVASIHRIPLSELLRDDAPILNHVRGAPHPVLRMPVGGRWIAAPTAALLYQFREVCLLTRATRVAHFDQPAFAWR